MNRISAENICTSNTAVRPRKDIYLFDYDCVNEAVINAIVHNDWTVSEPQISFYSDRLEIVSHGGLPHDLTKEEFYRGISKPRNLKLMKIFSDLDIVEHTGHGIPNYSLDYNNPNAVGKAEAYERGLGFNKANAESLISQIDDAVKNGTNSPIEIITSEFGIKYKFRIPVKGINGMIKNVIAVYQIDAGSEIPRLITNF